jgi:hypothetical protein
LLIELVCEPKKEFPITARNAIAILKPDKNAGPSDMSLTPGWFCFKLWAWDSITLWATGRRLGKTGPRPLDWIGEISEEWIGRSGVEDSIRHSRKGRLSHGLRTGVGKSVSLRTITVTVSAYIIEKVELSGFFFD